jgi:hypothetical protein
MPVAGVAAGAAGQLGAAPVHQAHQAKGQGKARASLPVANMLTLI